MHMINKDAILLSLKSRLYKAERRNDKQDMLITKAVMAIIRQMPESEIMESTICDTCYHYDKKTHTCLHSKGLPGRVEPTMFCYYGSPVDNGTGDEPEDDFDEFEEE